MYVIIAGCGRVGAVLANYLSLERHDVVVIDKSGAAFDRLGSAFNGVTLEGVAFDEELLTEAGIDQADIFAAVTNQDNTNMMAAEVATNVYGVPRVISRLYDPARELTYFRMGIDYVCGTSLMTDRIRERLFQGTQVAVQQDRLDIGLQVVEFNVDEAARGHLAGELNYGVSSRLLSVVRDNREIAWNDRTPLEEGDILLVTLRRDGWRAVRDCLGADSVALGMCPADLMSAAEIAARPEHLEPEQTRVIVGGCSMVGAHLGYLLSMDGYDVTIIDEDTDKFKRLPAQYAGKTLEGVIYDEETLLEAGVTETTAFVAVTKFDNKNLMASEVVRHIFGVPYVIGRLFNPDKEVTYQALGMSYVCGTRIVAQTMLERLLEPRVAICTSCCINKFDLVEFSCPTAWDGKTIGKAAEASSLRIAYVTRRATGYLPEANFVLRAGDSITALATEKRRAWLEKLLDKDRGRGENNPRRD
jgi:trk system potassium uptake protein